MKADFMEGAILYECRIFCGFESHSQTHTTESLLGRSNKLL